MNRTFIPNLILLYACLPTSVAMGKPNAVAVFCQTYADQPSCRGSLPSCNLCHLQEPPVLNAYGGSIKAELGSLSSEEFYQQLPQALAAIEIGDADDDGASNGDEIRLGTLPGSADSLPKADHCGEVSPEEGGHSSCHLDHDYVYRKVWLDFCGEPPLWQSYKEFKVKSENEKRTAINTQLDSCLNSDNWLGRDGVIWRLGHEKIRPIGSIKSGKNPGIIPILDYDPDYQLFVYSQIDDHDARDVLKADYTVEMTEDVNSGTTYEKRDTDRLLDGGVMQVERRAGLLTTFWNLAFYLNFTGVPRVLVAQTMRSFLGLTMARYQGLIYAPDELTGFADYDNSGVTQPKCAVCHRVIDPMAYPFKFYNGLPGVQGNILSGETNAQLQSLEALGNQDNLTPLSYALPREDFFVNEKGMTKFRNMPETGYVLGQKVENLQQWAEVVANNDLFAAQAVRDYWKILMGQEPRASEQQEFDQIWQRFKQQHQFRIEPMLKELIWTRAYSVH